MASPIRFYFDFASPFAWIAMPGITKLGADHGRAIEWRPVLLWAILKEQDIAPPANSPAKWRYLVADMGRSAAFHGVPYKQPPKFTMSTHRAARLFYEIDRHDPAKAMRFGRDVLSAFSAAEQDISEADVLCAIAERHGLSAAEAIIAMEGQHGRARLADVIKDGVADGVCGSPFFVIDDETFFGADRLPQIAWHLNGRQ
jgi:2-hydroxychromene-2-carboxylate isomerase